MWTVRFYTVYLKVLGPKLLANVFKGFLLLFLCGLLIKQLLTSEMGLEGWEEQAKSISQIRFSSSCILRL